MATLKDWVKSPTDYTLDNKTGDITADRDSRDTDSSGWKTTTEALKSQGYDRSGNKRR